MPHSGGIGFNRDHEDGPREFAGTSFVMTAAPAAAPEWEHHMMKKMAQGLMALTLGVGMISASYQPAEAHGRGVGVGIAAGIIGLGILGAAASARPYYREGCYRGPERCEWTDRHCFYNRYDEYVCRGGRYRCWRPTYCD